MATKSLHDLQRSNETVSVSEAKLAIVLQLIRDTLGSPILMSRSNIEYLHTAEALLAAELGYPIWT